MSVTTYLVILTDLKEAHNYAAYLIFIVTGK